MPTVAVNLDTTQYVKVNNGLNPLLLQAHRDAVRVVLNSVKPAITNKVFHVLGGGDPPLTFDSIDVDVWALSLSNDSSLIVSELNPVDVVLIGDDGNPIGSVNGNLNVHTGDVHTNVINQFFHLDTGVESTLSSDADAGDTVINFVDASVFSVGNFIEIVSVPEESVFSRIVSISVNEVTIDGPLDGDYLSGFVVKEVSFDMAVNGSLASPISFRLIPIGDSTLHIWTLVLGMVHGSAADDAKFADLSPLTNGVILRYYSGQLDKFFKLTNWKSNYDIKLDLFNLAYTDKAGPSSFGTNGLGALKGQTGAISELIGANGDHLEILIQDDLTSLDRFQIKAQGHIEGQF